MLNGIIDFKIIIYISSLFLGGILISNFDNFSNLGKSFNINLLKPTSAIEKAVNNANRLGKMSSDPSSILHQAVGNIDRFNSLNGLNNDLLKPTSAIDKAVDNANKISRMAINPSSVLHQAASNIDNFNSLSGFNVGISKPTSAIDKALNNANRISKIGINSFSLPSQSFVNSNSLFNKKISSISSVRYLGKSSFFDMNDFFNVSDVIYNRINNLHHHSGLSFDKSLSISSDIIKRFNDAKKYNYYFTDYDSLDVSNEAVDDLFNDYYSSSINHNDNTDDSNKTINDSNKTTNITVYNYNVYENTGNSKSFFGYTFEVIGAISSVISLAQFIYDLFH